MKINSFSEIKKIVEDAKKENKIIVTTNGVFDILHLGHIKFLEKAKSFGDILIVAVNSDSSVKKIKGDKRPIKNEKERAELVFSLKPVDYAFIFHEDTPVKFLSVLKPDIHVKGGDYKGNDLIEKDVVEGSGGKVKIIKLEKGYSTTDTINKILNNYKKR